MQYDEFEAMMTWALGSNWRHTNRESAGAIFKENHPELSDLNAVVDKYGNIQSAFFISQIVDKWRLCNEYKNFFDCNHSTKVKEQKDDPILSDIRAMWNNILRVLGLRE
jgi:hypothetical protein